VNVAETSERQLETYAVDAESGWTRKRALHGDVDVPTGRGGHYLAVSSRLKTL